MTKRLTLRLVSIVAASAALLLLTPGPASATTTFTIVDGHVLIEDFNGTNDIDVPLDGEGPCDPPEVAMSTILFPKRWILGDLIIVLFPDLFPGPWLIAMSLSPLNGADQDGPYDDPGTGDVGPISVGLQVDFSDDTNEDCVPDDDPVCSLYFEADLNGSYTGTAPSAITGFELDMTTTLPLTPISESCPAPVTTYIDGTVSGSFVGEV